MSANTLPAVPLYTNDGHTSYQATLAHIRRLSALETQF